MRSRVVLCAWLVVVWCLLWERLSVANVASGVAVSMLLLAVFPAGGRRVATVHPLHAARFAVYFLWKLVEATAIVAWEVATPRNRIHEGVIALDLRTRSDVVATIVANAISLTPGTLTIEADRDASVLYVHVLHLGDVDRVRADLRRLESLAIAAFALGDDGTPDGGVELAEAMAPSEAGRRGRQTPWRR